MATTSLLKREIKFVSIISLCALLWTLTPDAFAVSGKNKNIKISLRNPTINLNQIELLLANVEGVSSVPMVKIINKCGGRYSTNSYNIEAATKNKVVYPSLDPSIFEVKFPNSDIKGRAR